MMRRFAIVYSPLLVGLVAMVLIFGDEAIMFTVNAVSAWLPPPPSDISMAMWSFVSLGAAAAAGAYRGAFFHPTFRPAYAKWLAITPWQDGEPLPMGPVRLVWQDAVLAGVFLTCAKLNNAPFGIVELAAAFVAPYVIVLTLINLATPQLENGEPRHKARLAAGTVAALFILPGVVLTLGHWILTLSLLLLAYVANLHGLRAGFREFVETARTQDVQLAKEVTGWPYNRLAPNEDGPMFSPAASVLAALLAGWYAFVANAAFARVGEISLEESAAGGVEFAMLLMVIAAFGRWVMYAVNRSAPISLFGRIFTGRWIIPGYDKVFVAPLLAVTASGLVMVLGVSEVLPMTVALPASLFAGVFTLCAGGPNYDEWELTGDMQLCRSTIRIECEPQTRQQRDRQGCYRG
jgi:hypothetical protein